MNIDLDFFEYADGLYERREESFSEKAYELDAIRGILNKYDFEVKGVFDGFSLSPVTPTSQRAVFTAVKK